MSRKYSKATFWKCALQVNPSEYIQYRGKKHEMTAEEYNQQLLRVAKENNITIIGLADHGNVDGVDEIRSLMKQNDIIVFPGFEIASTEKVHFVCLFPEETSKDDLNRYLGALGLEKPLNNIWPSSLGGNALIKKVDSLGGFIFAAHCTDDNGLLKRGGLNHIWQDPLLKAAQIPGTIDELSTPELYGYKEILLNKNPDYKREQCIAIINAKDVAVPEDLGNPKASCLIKMTQPCFESFKQAFQDHQSRVRLNSDISQQYYSRIENLKVIGGYLDGLNIHFSEHLNAIIGGRGTGKSTVLECIRFALQIPPISSNAKKQHEQIIKENIGKSKARVELSIRSSHFNGKRFTVARSYGENAIVKDENGNHSVFTPSELLPNLELYGQNEIYEIAQDNTGQRKLLDRFLTTGDNTLHTEIEKTLTQLVDNRTEINEAKLNASQIEDDVIKLPKLEEQLKHYEELGLKDKLKIISDLETEKQHQKLIIENVSSLNTAFDSINSTFYDTTYLASEKISNLPHKDILEELKIEMDLLKKEATDLLNNWATIYADAEIKLNEINSRLSLAIQAEESGLNKLFKELPSLEGKSGEEIGMTYQSLQEKIAAIRPKEASLTNYQTTLDKLESQRLILLDKLSSLKASRSAQSSQALKKLNKKLSGRLRLTIKPEGDRTPVIKHLLNCNLDNVGENRLSWINDIDDFSPIHLSKLIQQGVDAIKSVGWHIPNTVADAFIRMTSDNILALQELELPDLISIELNIAHDEKENYRPLDKLSTGQQCTAILHLLLLQNVDPLLMDQPEDNLDNAFIAERIVSELRLAKVSRQFIFTTHNANIPVFGDAEWIGILETEDGQAVMQPGCQGAIDLPSVKDKAAKILEGGRAAFNQRKVKYGF
ncbi:TPA: AAA family ATPase [Legionella pneumophila]|nr:AAA family ATPase [Legionella pneumophila]HAU1496593.1 AAA family ATPase [Legionella pneumophila]